MRNKASSPCRRTLPYSCTGKWHKLCEYNCTYADLKHLPRSFYRHKPLNKEEKKSYALLAEIYQ